jgi:hypothetical protein
MTTYPLEFYRRAEEKWRRRAGPLRASERPSRTARASRHQSICIDRAALITKGGLPPPHEGDDILVRRPWLLAIGQGLQAQYDAFEQPVPEPLAALLRELGQSPMADAQPDS